MKSSILYPTVFCTLLVPVHTTAFADTSEKASATPRLILVLDVKELARHLNNTASYTNQYTPPNSRAETLLETKPDVVNKTFSDAKKIFKRFTSLRYRKGEKIRAKVGKSSFTLKYTRAL